MSNKGTSVHCWLALIAILGIMLFPFPVLSQVNNRFQGLEDSLKIFRDSVRKAETDSARIALGEQFDQEMLRVFSLPGSFEFPFDSLKSVNLLRSPDNEFRICTWNIPLLSGRFEYSGLIQWNEKKHPDRKPVMLAGEGDSISTPDTALLDPRHWYGAIYYKAIPEGSGKQVSYTLLGWKGASSFITQKVIDVLCFNDKGEARFGKRMFPGYGNGKNSRIIFRFSAGSSMTLRYDQQNIILSRKWNASKKEYIVREKREWMIICDRLVPIDPKLEGDYRYYVPASDIYDGFKYEQGNWRFVTGIEARNP